MQRYKKAGLKGMLIAVGTAPTMLSASVKFVFPPPPKPDSALNMPGHVKQTKATIPSWILGEAYHGIVQKRSLRWRYIHPDGRATTPSASYSGGVRAAAAPASNSVSVDGANDFSTAASTGVTSGALSSAMVEVDLFLRRSA
jgi:hypothetical protein